MNKSHERIHLALVFLCSCGGWTAEIRPAATNCREVADYAYQDCREREGEYAGEFCAAMMAKHYEWCVADEERACGSFEVPQ